MKLERIHVERYGAWQNLDLPVDADGLSVFFGPNEAGKTTLMRFIRGVLYGFDDEDVRRLKDADFGTPWGGALQIRHRDDSWIIRRTGKVGSRGILTAQCVEHGSDETLTDGGSLLRELTGGVSETVYENVFAVGLPELQQLATLEADEVAEHLYSASMGIEGRRLLRLIDDARQAGRDLLDLEHGTGRIPEKYEYLAAIDRQLEGTQETRRRHSRLSSERQQHEDTIGDLRHRQAGLEEQLNGHEYMDLIWDPWRKVQQLERELSKLPQASDFPKEGLKTLKQLDADIATQRQQREALHAQAKQLREQRCRIDIDPQLRRYAPTLQSMVDQREWITEIVQFAQESIKEANSMHLELEDRLKQLGAGWSVERLKTVDVPHLATTCLHARATEFRRAEQRLRWVRRRYRKTAARCHRQRQELVRIKTELGVETFDSAVTRTREQLEHIAQWSQLRIRRSELTEQQTQVTEQQKDLDVETALPQWVYVVFSALGLVGLILGISGLSLGLQSNFLAGMGYFMLGVCCEGLSWSLRKHFEGRVRATKEKLAAELAQIEQDLVATEQQIEELEVSLFGPKPLPPEPIVPIVPVSAAFRAISVELPANYAEGDATPASVAEVTAREGTSVAALKAHLARRHSKLAEAAKQLSATDEAQANKPTAKSFLVEDLVPFSTLLPRSATQAELLQMCHLRLAQLEELKRWEQRVTRTRHRLIEKRMRLHDTQREFGVARQLWMNQLRQMQLTETTDIDAALAERDAVARCAGLWQRREAVLTDANLGKKLFQKYRAKVEEFGHNVMHWKRDYSNPLVVLEDWKNQLAALADKLQERRRLRRAVQQTLRQGSLCRIKLRRLESQQAALLVRGGVDSVEEFADRAAKLERRVAVDDQLSRARTELERVALSNGSLAVTEDDLHRFNRDQNTAAINTIRQELDDIAADLSKTAEALSRVKQDLRVVESDSTHAELRFEREQVLTEITNLTEEWLANEWSLQTLEALRGEFERHHQTPILARAKDILRRLSTNRYTNIWTPLGERGLCVDTDSGESLRIENLSSGAQEQLFLAIRLALIEHFGKDGIHLPVVLDDILVNFDLERTRIAVEELLRLSQDSQQILFFTCHQHLSELFRQRGVSTVLLPVRETVERLAG